MDAYKRHAQSALTESEWPAQEEHSTLLKRHHQEMDAVWNFGRDNALEILEFTGKPACDPETGCTPEEMAPRPPRRAPRIPMDLFPDQEVA